MIKIHVDLVGLKLKKIVAELGFDPSPCVDGPLGYMFARNSAQDPTATRLNWFRLRRKRGESVRFEVELFSVIRAPRIISTLQRLCEHGKAANEAAE